MFTPKYFANPYQELDWEWDENIINEITFWESIND